MFHHAGEEIRMLTISTRHHRQPRSRFVSTLIAVAIAACGVTNAAATPEAPRTPGALVRHGTAQVSDTIGGIYLFHWDGTSLPA
jgi:hypothetical protein